MEIFSRRRQIRLLRMIIQFLRYRHVVLVIYSLKVINEMSTIKENKAQKL